MTQNEFETRTSLKYNTEDFDLINRLYLAAGELNKDIFCEDFKNHKTMLDSRIVVEMLYHCEQLAKTVADFQNIIRDQATQLDAARANMEAYRKQIDIADEKVGRLQQLVDATVENINLACFNDLRKTFEHHLGKIETMRLRKEAGWTLSSDDIDYLLDHCVEK